MALEYTSDGEKFEHLAMLLEAYYRWFSKVMIATMYPDDVNNFEALTVPTQLPSVIRSFEGSMSQVVIEDTIALYDVMLDQANPLLAEFRVERKQPPTDTIRQFVDSYEAVISQIQRLQKFIFVEEGGLDNRTGLKNTQVMQEDLRLEMERIARLGDQFSLLMARLDDYEDHKSDEDIKTAVICIKKCMRPFDDAYYLGRGQFLISLKNTDTVGAHAAVNRLQLFLSTEEKNVNRFTMSYCLSELMEGDDIDEIINNMRDDLNAETKNRDAVLELVEKSQLQRYVDNMIE